MAALVWTVGVMGCGGKGSATSDAHEDDAPAAMDAPVQPVDGPPPVDAPRDAPPVIAPSNLTYAVNPAVFTKGETIANDAPTSAGDPVGSYAITPALPTGLFFSATTGVISGTPAVLSPATSYTATATNAGGSTTATLTIVVNDVAPSALTYSANPATYTQGQAITNNTPTSSGGPVVTYAIAPALPAGLSFSTTTGIVSGTPTIPTPAAAYTVTATNTGGSTTATLTISVGIGACHPTAAPTAVPTSTAACNPLTQTGCAAGEKCTWIQDQASPRLGHAGCVAAGSVQLDCACTTGTIGVAGYDDCGKGALCIQGKCEVICDPAGGGPLCNAQHACATYDGVFGAEGQSSSAGVCDTLCDPLADNDFLATGTKPGTACPATATPTGCFGTPRTTAPTQYSCAREVSPTLVHRTACTAAGGCLSSSGSPFSNGCAQGYEPLMFDSTGSTQIDCIAMCKPGNAYLGNPGTQLPAGQAPHACATTDARGVFDPATSTHNGDHCTYSWVFELDANGMLVRSATSDTLGFCIDHSKYRYDSNGDGLLDGTDAVWPLCASLPLTSSTGGLTAGDFGCVDTATTGVFLTTPRPQPALRFPHHTRAR